MKGNKKKILIIISILVGVFLLAYLLWSFWLQNLYTFHQNEKQLREAGEKYFELNAKRLPSKDNDVSVVTLKTLYKEKWIDTLSVSKSSKLCDTSSWVKVRRENGKNVYYTYLKCDKYESKTDHTGPDILLNGDDEISISRGSTYQELGVKEVKDDHDGTIKPDQVKINHKIDTSKIGTYEVTYTAYDSLKNKTEKVRVVKVVDMLNTVTKNSTGELNYFKGNVSNNYVWFSSMLWRIVGVNDDNTVKLISAYPVGNMNYNTQKGTFEDSDIKKWLNEYFYDHISSRAKEFIVKDSTWCNDSISENELNKMTCDKWTKEVPVGLLSIQEFNRSLMEDNSSFLQGTYMYWLLNPNGTNGGWVNRNDFITVDEVNLLNFSSNTLIGVRPVINVVKDTTIIKGSGTINDPYLLDDYQQARLQTKLSERQSGEYLTYSGYVWRIIEVGEDNTTKVVMDNVLRHNDTVITISYDNGNNDKIYNPKQKGNICYQISNQLNSYVNTKLFVNKEIEVPVYDEYATYQPSRLDKFQTKISIPNAYELFSTKNTMGDYSNYWFINSSKNTNIQYTMANAGSPYTELIQAGVKLVGYLKDSVRITAGTGLREDPYYIKG